MSDTDRLLALSLILKAIDDCDQELTQFKAEHKARRETLRTQLNQIRWEVLSGQERLPLEPVSPPAMPVTPIAETMQRVADEINSGVLDTPGVKCSAIFDPASEASTEERKRTHKPKLRGQDAILPDKRAPQPGAPA